MALLPNQLPNNQQATGTQTPTASNTAQQAGQSERDRQKRGTGFTNISRVVGANQGAGQRIGEKIGSTIKNQADSVRSGIEAGRAQFNTNQQQGQQQAQQQLQPAQQLVRQTGENEAAYANRVAQATTGQDVNQIGTNLRNAQYTGPTGLENEGQLQSNAATAGALARLAGSQAGQGELARQMIAGRGRYTSGQGALDQLLFGREGQQQIRQGRSAATGINQQAQNAAQSARQIAEGTAAAIDTDRTAALKGLSQGVTDIDAYGTKQAESFAKDTNDLKDVLTGNYDATTPEAKARAEDLISRFSEYGLNDQDVYMGNVRNPEQYKNSLSELAASASTNFGARKFNDQEKLAGQNLASILNDQSTAEAFKNNQFDTDAFKAKEGDVFKSLEDQKLADTQTQKYLQGLSGQAKVAEADFQKARDLQAQLNQMQAEVGGSLDGGDLVRKMKEDPEFANRWNSIQEQLQPLGGYGVGDRLNYNTEMQSARNLGNMYHRDDQGNSTGFLQFADRGDQDIAERFRGLGLTKSSGTSGDLRGSAEYDRAAANALGQTKSLKQILLDRLAKGQV